jgi:hypothetical protein
LILSPIRVLIAQRLQITMKATPIDTAGPKVAPFGAVEAACKPTTSTYETIGDEGTAMRVLVIEDSARLRRSLHHGLRRAGFAVDMTADGNMGLAFAQTFAYDVVVLDLMLPGIASVRTTTHLPTARMKMTLTRTGAISIPRNTLSGPPYSS